MKFNITQEAFVNSINYVEKAVSSKETMPILAGIYLKAVKNKGLHLIGNDLELGIECWAEAKIIEEGEIVLPSNYLSNLVRELPEDIIKVEVNLDSYQANLKCGDSDFDIKGYDAEEFPELPEVSEDNKFNIISEKLLKIVDRVKFATLNDESQPALTGALLETTDDKIIMVSTNTYRMAYTEVDIEEENINNKHKIIIPGSTLNELSRLLPDSEEQVEIQIDSNHCCFKFNEITVISRLIEGQFPNYNQVIPDQYNTRITVNTKEFHQATKRVSLIAREESNIISLFTSKDNKKINLDSAETDSGEGHEEVNIEINGPDQDIRIDAGYLLDVLKILKNKEIIIDLIGPLNPLTIKNSEDENYIYLIMPIRSE